MRFTNILLSTTLLTTVFGAHKVMAQVNCATIPDCGSLGYSSSAGSCDGTWLYCPFNSNYKKCIPNAATDTCTGFTNTDKTSWCKTVVPCATDTTLTLCAEVADCPSEYNLSTCDANGTCDACFNGTGSLKYKLSGCKSGYVKATIKGVEGCHRYYNSCEEANLYTVPYGNSNTSETSAASGTSGTSGTSGGLCGVPSAYIINSKGEEVGCYREECIICETTCTDSAGYTCLQQCNIMEDSCLDTDTQCKAEAAKYCDGCYTSKYTTTCKGTSTSKTTEKTVYGAQCGQAYKSGSVESGQNSHGVGGGGVGCVAPDDCYSGAAGNGINACLRCDYAYNDLPNKSIMVASLSKEEARAKYCQSTISDDDFPVYNA